MRLCDYSWTQKYVIPENILRYIYICKLPRERLIGGLLVPLRRIPWGRVLCSPYLSFGDYRGVPLKGRF